MKINKHALDRVRKAPMSGEGTADILLSMAAGATLDGAEGVSLTLDYQHEDDPVGPGDMIPIITLSLRSATIE
jgi:hypothetical protein